MSVIKKIVIYILSALVPRGRVLLFTSVPDYTDNPYALFLYIIRNRTFFSDYAFVWMFSDKTRQQELEKRVLRDCPEVVFPKGRLQEWWYVLRARFVIYSHAFYNDYRFAQNDKRINLWHGTGFKKVGVDNGETPARLDRLVTTNRVWQKYLAHSFAVSPEQVWVTGEPRTDLFFTPTDFFDLYGIDRCRYSSIGIWLPTFRKHNEEDRLDGVFDEYRLAGFSFDDLRELDDCLCASGGLLIVKLHIYDSLQNTAFPEFGNIVVLKQSDFRSQLYPLLGATDYLLTDYSSVSFDYDILGRPMGFVLRDVNDYRSTRGFYGDVDCIEDLLPGKVITTLEGLKDFVTDYKNCFVATGNRFNEYKDAGACKRVVEEMAKLVGR